MKVAKRNVWELKRIKGLYACIVTILILMFANIQVQAVEFTVKPVNAVLYAGDGAEVFAQPDATTVVTVFPGDTPIQVTGITNKGYFQVLIDGSTYYMYGKALSTRTGTTAYRLTSVDAKAALVADATTGEVIYMQGGLDRLAPASTTKIMTALLTLEAIAQGQISLDTQVVVSASALAGIPSDASHVSPRLKKGEVMSIMSLLQCTLVKSDCHACNVLAEAVAGSVDNFVAMMNLKATAIGCVDTNFVNTSGYPAANHYTNAYSLFLIAKEAMKYQTFQDIVGMTKVVIPATNLSKAREFSTTNELIKNSSYYNPEVTGTKTGYSKSSGSCLVASATRNDKTVISVILGAQTKEMSDGVRTKLQFSETNKLLEIGLAGA